MLCTPIGFRVWSCEARYQNMQHLKETLREAANSSIRSSRPTSRGGFAPKAGVNGFLPCAHKSASGLICL